MGERPLIKTVAPGWLAKSIAGARAFYEANKDYCDAIHANWGRPPRETDKDNSPEGGDREEAKDHPMTDQALEEAARAATPGPWWRDSMRLLYGPGDVFLGLIVKLADATYLAACEPSRILDLLSRLRAAEARVGELEEIAQEALEEWEYAASYKGDYLREKHGDDENIATLRAALSRLSSPGGGGKEEGGLSRYLAHTHNAAPAFGLAGQQRGASGAGEER